MGSRATGLPPPLAIRLGFPHSHRSGYGTRSIKHHGKVHAGELALGNPLRAAFRQAAADDRIRLQAATR